MLIVFVTMFLLTATAITYWLVRHFRTRRRKTALQVCVNREESARATCWQSMLIVAELLRFENPDADEPKQIHRRLVRHVQCSRSMSSDDGAMTIEMLDSLLDISSHTRLRDYTEARARMFDAACAWRTARTERTAAEKALTASRRRVWSDVSVTAGSQSETAAPSSYSVDEGAWGQRRRPPR